MLPHLTPPVIGAVATTQQQEQQQQNQPRHQLSTGARPWIPATSPEEQQKIAMQERHNIHFNSVLNRIHFVPYAVSGCREYDVPPCAANYALVKNVFKFRRLNSSDDDVKPVTVYFGGQGLTPTRNIIWNLITCLGVTPLRVAVDKIKKNKHGFTASPMCMAELRCKEDADKVIASLHRRALLDETGFYLAQTKEQVQVLSRYCDMLAHYKNLPRSKENSGNNSPSSSSSSSSNSSQGSNVSSRKEQERLLPTFIHRPHALMTVTREGKNKKYENERNPLCDCDTCQQYFYSATPGNPVASAYNHVNVVYSPAVLSAICILVSSGDTLENILIPTHALITIKYRPDFAPGNAYVNVYCDVSPGALANCRTMAVRYWMDEEHKWYNFAQVTRRPCCTAEAQEAANDDGVVAAAPVPVVNNNANRHRNGAIAGPRTHRVHGQIARGSSASSSASSSSATS